MYIIGSKDNNILYKKLLEKKDDIVCMNFGLIMVSDWELQNKIRLYLNCNCNWLIHTFHKYRLTLDNTILNKWHARQMYAYKYIVINKQRTVKLLSGYKKHFNNITTVSFKRHISLSNGTNKLLTIDESPHIKNFLKKLGYNLTGKRPLFCGTMAVINELMEKDKNNSKEEINLMGFTLNNKHNICSFYHEKKEKKPAHDRDVDINLLIWLHNNNYIDATLCFFSFINDIPTLDMKNIIKPTEKMLKLIISKYENVVIK